MLNYSVEHKPSAATPEETTWWQLFSDDGPALCFASPILVIDEQRETFFEAEPADLGIFRLPANGFSHAEEFHRMEFLDRGLH